MAYWLLIGIHGGGTNASSKQSHRYLAMLLTPRLVLAGTWGIAPEPRTTARWPKLATWQRDASDTAELAGRAGGRVRA